MPMSHLLPNFQYTQECKMPQFVLFGYQIPCVCMFRFGVWIMISKKCKRSLMKMMISYKPSHSDCGDEVYKAVANAL
ncbi:hypothetical protein RHMOL_Rhmol02G0307900 [Rhododendron molle]|uniref:Uncharacterized protein n=1 Tax=Rhododendron molle TaxID=49168 RepID=A0ACC0PXE7_RHOML|nr:hypothetical protein RHMOL_Rhmol02G0307900 [Rhododendron molle]